MVEIDEDDDGGPALKDDVVKLLGTCLVPERSYTITLSGVSCFLFLCARPIIPPCLFRQVSLTSIHSVHQIFNLRCFAFTQREVFRKPVTDTGKTSKRGRLALKRDGGSYTTTEHVRAECKEVGTSTCIFLPRK